MKKIKLERYPYGGYNIITRGELKIYMLLYYYPHLKIEYKQNTKLWKDEISREFIITKIKDCYECVSTIVYSINGSPPKGVAILLKCSDGNDEKGSLVIFGNGKNSVSYPVIIKKKGDTNEGGRYK